MAYWQEWLRGVLALLVLLGILERLLPIGGLAKFSRLVFGLALMLVFLQPITILLQQDFVPPDWPVFQINTLPKEVEEQAERIIWSANKSLWSAGVRQKEEELETVLIQIESVKKISVELVESRGELEQVSVLLEPLNKELQGRIEHVVSAMLNLSRDRIKVAQWPD